VVRTIGAAAAIVIALVVVLRPVLLGNGWSGLDLLATAAVLLGAGLVLRRQGGFTRSMGLLPLVFGVVGLGLAIAVLAFAVLWCCP
jgi:hypothetical protein